MLDQCQKYQQSRLQVVFQVPVITLIAISILLFRKTREKDKLSKTTTKVEVCTSRAKQYSACQRLSVQLLRFVSEMFENVYVDVSN